MPDTKRGPFARRTPSRHVELVGLFSLLDALPSNDIRVSLSHYTREKLRAVFPQGTSPADVVELANGLDIEVDTGDLFGAEFFIGHCNEARVIDAISRTLPEGARVIDVGANFGVFTLHSAHVAGEQCRVIAFEPAPIAHSLLAANVRRNGFEDRVDVRRTAVGAKPGVTTFHVAADESFSGLRATGRSPLRESIDVSVTSLDADEDVKALGRVDFLKIDTEGGEGEVLIGATETIRRSPKLVVLMEYSAKNLTDAQAQTVRSCIGSLIKEGLEAWVIDADDIPVALRSLDALPAAFSGSILLARRETQWAQNLLSLLRTPEGTTRGIEPPIAAALAGLIKNLREAQIKVSTAQSDAASAVRGSADELTDARERLAEAEVTRAGLVEQVEAAMEKVASLRKETIAWRDRLATVGIALDSKEGDIAQLNAKLATANGLSSQLREALAKRQSSFDQLEQRIREEMKAHALARTELAAARTELAAARTELAAARDEIHKGREVIVGFIAGDQPENPLSADLQTHPAYGPAAGTPLADSIAALSQHLAMIVSERDRLTVEVAELTTAFESRRDMMRALQQQIALFKLGRHRKDR